jgi:hypothetical protein
MAARFRLSWNWPWFDAPSPKKATEMSCHADRDGLLSRVQMKEAGELPGGYEVGELLLEGTNAAHAAIRIEQALARELHGTPR